MFLTINFTYGIEKDNKSVFLYELALGKRMEVQVSARLALIVVWSCQVSTLVSVQPCLDMLGQVRSDHFQKNRLQPTLVYFSIVFLKLFK